MKKKLALILAAVMMLGLFAGCSNKTPHRQRHAFRQRQRRCHAGRRVLL